MRILVIDDDPLSCESLETFLTTYLGHQVDCTDNCKKGLELFDQNPYPIVISDIRMPGMSGIKLLQEIKKNTKGKNTDVIIITGHGELSTAIEALRAGAYDYLLKPIDVEELAVIVDRVAEHRTLLKENYALKNRFNEKLKESTREIKAKMHHFQSAYAEVTGIGKIGVFSDAMRDIIQVVEKLHEDRDIPVLIEGETGTGKEIIARMIHYKNSKDSRPFVTLNCSAISPNLFESELFGYESGAFSGANRKGMMGKLELAHEGTLFLDEIGDMPLDMQPKLLRVLQQKEIYRIGGTKKIKLDLRIICATNRDVSKLIEKNIFRKDLYYRLNTANILIPPLRDRKEEIGPLAQMFLLNYAKQKKRDFKAIRKDALEILEDYSWPGNVRELQNTIERVILLYNDLEVKPEYLNFLDLKSEIRSKKNKNLMIEYPKEGLSLDMIEKKIIKDVLKRFHGNISKTANYLKISRNRLKRKLET